jgi:hypothetical protein
MEATRRGIEESMRVQHRGGGKAASEAVIYQHEVDRLRQGRHDLRRGGGEWGWGNASREEGGGREEYTEPPAVFY